jgi:hypothetical protein
MIILMLSLLVAVAAIIILVTWAVQTQKELNRAGPRQKMHKVLLLTDTGSRSIMMSEAELATIIGLDVEFELRSFRRR